MFSSHGGFHRRNPFRYTAFIMKGVKRNALLLGKRGLEQLHVCNEYHHLISWFKSIYPFDGAKFALNVTMNFKSAWDYHVLTLRVPKCKSRVTLRFIHENSANNSSQGLDCKYEGLDGGGGLVFNIQ